MLTHPYVCTICMYVYIHVYVLIPHMYVGTYDFYNSGAGFYYYVCSAACAPSYY
jgi:hypothetical protein